MKVPPKNVRALIDVFAWLDLGRCRSTTFPNSKDGTPKKIPLKTIHLHLPGREFVRESIEGGTRYTRVK